MAERRREDGQSVLIIAFIVVVILALLALVVDIGNAYAQRRLVQNAVDASAMACTARLAQQGPLVSCAWGPCRQDPVTDDQIEDLMRDYAELNGMERTKAEGMYMDSSGNALATVGSLEGSVVPYNAMGVRVHGDLTFGTYFAHLLGVDQLTVDAPGAAYVLTGPCSNDRLFPIGMIESTFCAPGQTGPCAPTIGETYTVWDKDPKTEPGNFGWLYWVRWDDPDEVVVGTVPPEQNSNTTNLAANIVNPSRSGTWHAGDYVKGNTGVSLQPVLAELTPYIQGTDPESVIIPIYDHAIGGGDQVKYRITGFAAFQLTCVWNANNQYIEREPGDCNTCADSSDKCINGYFEQMITEPFDDGCLDTGLTAPSYRMPTQP